MMVSSEGNTNRECSFFFGWNSGVCGFVGLWDGGVCGMEMNKKSGGGDVRASKSPSETAYRGQLHPSERRNLKRSLEPAKPKR